MSNLSQIKADSNWGDASNTINTNFQNMDVELEKLKNSTTRFKGYFTSESNLKNKFPSPKRGDIAFVGEPYPGNVYDVLTDGSWHNTAKAPETGSVDLQDYVTKDDFDASQKEQDDKLTELEKKTGNNILEWNTDAATTRKQVPLENRKAGMQISYQPTDGDWVNEQYIGTSFTDIEWENDNNWDKIPNQEQLSILKGNVNMVVKNSTNLLPLLQSSDTQLWVGSDGIYHNNNSEYKGSKINIKEFEVNTLSVTPRTGQIAIISFVKGEIVEEGKVEFASGYSKFILLEDEETFNIPSDCENIIINYYDGGVDKTPSSLDVAYLDNNELKKEIEGINQELYTINLLPYLQSSDTQVWVHSNGMYNSNNSEFKGSKINIKEFGISKLIVTPKVGQFAIISFVKGEIVAGGKVEFASGYSAFVLFREEKVFDIPSDCENIIINYYDGKIDITPLIFNAITDSRITMIENEIGEIKKNSYTSITDISTINLVTTNVFFIHSNFKLKQEEEGGKAVYYYSKDYGTNWNKINRELGDLMFVHIFSNNVWLLCTKTECLTTRDFSSFEQSSVLDYDGSKINPGNYSNAFFFLYGTKDNTTIINGKETLIWPDYYEGGGYISRVWFTKDFGKTIKCICKNGETTIKEEPLSIRHFHSANWDKHEQCLWVTTGDNGDQCKLLKGKINSEDSFSFEEITKGDNFKFGEIFSDDIYLYLVTDYTQGQNTGIMRVSKLSDLSNIDNYIYVTKTIDNSAVVNYVEVDGIKFLNPDGIGWKKCYIADGDMQFKKILLEIDSSILAIDFVLGPCRGLNENGDFIFAVFTNGYDITALKFNSQISIDMTATLRQYVSNFNRKNKLIGFKSIR